MAKISDVASLAGVSSATVSRVLNGKQVRPKHKAAVDKAIRELEYSPDRTARSLRRRHSEVVTLILPDIENPFFTALARGVEDVAHQANLSVVLCNTDEQPEKQDRYLRVADVEKAAGVILAPCGPSRRLDKLVRDGRSVVIVDRYLEGAGVDQVTFDNEALGREATAALLQRGYRRIACVTGPTGTPTAVARARGWAQALQEFGLNPAENQVLHTNFRTDGGERAMAELLRQQNPPEAVLATNNLVGVGVLRVRSAQPRPAFGVSIIGDLPFITSGVEEVCLLSLQPRELGLTAARLLVDRLRGEEAPPQHLIQPAAGR